MNAIDATIARRVYSGKVMGSAIARRNPNVDFSTMSFWQFYLSLSMRVPCSSDYDLNFISIVRAYEYLEKNHGAGKNVTPEQRDREQKIVDELMAEIDPGPDPGPDGTYGMSLFLTQIH